MKKLLLIAIFFGVVFGMNAQTIQSVSPNTGSLGQTLQVTITGDNTEFLQVSDTYGVSFYNDLQQQFIVNSINLISNTEMTADITIPTSILPGLYDLRIYPNVFPYNPYSLSDAFNVTTNYNTISGNIRFDGNANGCDASDGPANSVRVVLNDGSTDRITFTNSTGDYIFYVPAGNYTVTAQVESPLFLMSPASASFNFATENNLSETQDFCLAPNGVHNDVNITIWPIGPARPGFDATYRLVYRNAGNQIMNGTVNFTFDDSRLDLVSSTTAPASQTLNNLNWNYTNLLPFENRTIDVILNANSPTETPPVNIGNIFNFTATVNPVSGDETPNDNTKNFNQTVVGSWDPNDKSVTEGSEVDIANVDDYLHYLIRFQNSGNFLAENVRVKDVLAANLDKSTLQIVSASHPYRSTLTSGNQLEFFFDNINLPPESQNEPASHGFIAFKIKPSNTVGIGSVIENTADIYFDFNFPIVTNTVTTTFTTLSSKNFDFEDGIVLYPNPAGDVLNIEIQSSVDTASVKIFNQLGQLVKTANDIGQGQTNTIAVGDLKTGTYFVQITTNKGTSTKKLIKS
jgi:uncharacterized repeat protein (TIGR01451 family)